jgi:hypothetical protein
MNASCNNGAPMLRFALVVLSGVILPFACFAQVDTANASSSPREASPCDLVRNPANYDGQWITVRGRVSMRFEDFSLYDPDCQAPHLPGVWLTFGGDQDEIATYCCVNPTRKKGADIEVGGRRVLLVRDEALREFQRVLQTQRLRRPDGHECEGDECYFYRPVTATITGLFLSGQDSGGSASPGYGHLGCCHLLVIRQVADVSAERTQVPAGGQFKCSRKVWSVGSSYATDLKNLLDCATSHDEACDHDRQTAFARIAAHWNDRIDAHGGHEGPYIFYASGDSTGGWISADLLTSYSTIAKDASETAKLTVTRQVCVPVSTEASPNLPSDRASCRDYAMSWRDDDASAQIVDGLMEKEKFDAADAKIADAAKTILSGGDQAWRLGDAKSAAWHALQEQAQKWGVVPNAALRLNECQDAAIPDQKSRIIGCDWYSRDGMQVLGVTLRKYPKSTKADPVGRDIPWIVTDINATICQIQPRQPAVR